jgi:hypothetical protein
MSRSRSRLAALGLATLASTLPAPTAGAADPDLRRVRVRSGEDAAAVAGALLGAQGRLRSGSCQQLLDGYRDARGRLLRENLAPLAMEPADYLTLLVIVDGGERGSGSLCRTRGVAAVTEPNGRVVYVCGGAFRALSQAHREHVLIHEMLHSLGLGENPPSAREINASVWARCGRAR